MPRLSGGTLTLDPNSITDQMISTSAAVDADKLQHIETASHDFGFEFNGTPTAKVFIVYVAKGAGILRGFHALLYDMGTSTSVTFDLKKNGTTVLSSVITITHGTADKAVVDATLSVTAFVADDVFTMHLAQSANTGAQGPFAFAEFEENVAS